MCAFTVHVLGERFLAITVVFLAYGLVSVSANKALLNFMATYKCYLYFYWILTVYLTLSHTYHTKGQVIINYVDLES